MRTDIRTVVDGRLRHRELAVLYRHPLTKRCLVAIFADCPCALEVTIDIDHRVRVLERFRTHLAEFPHHLGWRGLGAVAGRPAPLM